MSAIPRYLLPDTAVIAGDGWLSIGGCRLDELAAEYGTPLFVYDEDHLRSRCREAVAAFPDGVAYATKAFTCGAMIRIAVEEGMDLDVSTAGEIHVALSAGAPADRLIFHGNNKSNMELGMALNARLGRIVIDSMNEIDNLERLVAAGAPAPKVSLRINPGVRAHTHEFLQTGAPDSKFGIGVDGGRASAALERAAESPYMDLVGIHAHVGSQVFDVGSYERVVDALAPFVRGLNIGELSIGGGLGVPYVEGETAPTITEWGETVLAAVVAAGLDMKITAEPGRSIVASAALTLYSIGTIKEIEDVRTYVSVDGGMSDNPRPVLYGSGYEAFLPRSPGADRDKAVTVVGKHCESGDFIVRSAWVPGDVSIGDLLCTPVTGAYGHSMGSNYNMILRPPVVFAKDGGARVVVRRETLSDLVNRDLALS